MRKPLLRTCAALFVVSIVAAAASPACSSAGNSGGLPSTGDDNGAAGDGQGTGGTSGNFVGGGGKTGGGATSSGGSGATSGGGGSKGIMFDGGGDADPDAYWANDPPPMSCDGGPTPPPPGGTPDCPDDKNREGCSCPTPGMTAPCWPGYRKNRDHGICKDGMTTCVATNEVGAGQWGPCVGYVLPDPTATKGASACECFSGGQWLLANLSPCFVNNGMDGAVSTIMTGSQIDCPMIGSGPVTAPSQPWTTDTLKVDCAGHFKLCYTLKAGDSKNPQPTDCTLVKVCAESDYTTANQTQNWPSLPGWAATDAASSACATKFATSGGYGEMSVSGLSVECDEVADHVFNRVQYCPLSCNSNPSGPGCANCMAGGGGMFLGSFLPRRAGRAASRSDDVASRSRHPAGHSDDVVWS